MSSIVGYIGCMGFVGLFLFEIFVPYIELSSGFHILIFSVPLFSSRMTLCNVVQLDVSQVSDSEILLVWKQPKFDGNAPVICYRLEYKLADETEWKKVADNIDHEFYRMSGLESNRSYIFRLSARNSIGWSDAGVPSAPVTTKPAGIVVFKSVI